MVNVDTNTYAEISTNVPISDEKFNGAAAVGTIVYFAPYVRSPPRPPLHKCSHQASVACVAVALDVALPHGLDHAILKNADSPTPPNLSLLLTRISQLSCKATDCAWA